MTGKYAFEVETENHEDDSTLYDSIVSSFEHLNVSIEDATNIKKILTSRLDRAISLKREVELKEKAAAEAKEEAAASHLVILAKVEALKQAQHYAEGTNKMHAREVHAQRVVLANELKELQLRVSGVLNEGHRSLEVSDEMRRELKKRLNKAYKEKESAYNEKIEKETLANEALAVEEREMLKLVKESNRLKQETEKNSELQIIFKERESVVNILREDVSHKHEDIKLFIEHLDQPVQQLTGFLSSTQPLADLVLEEQKVKMNEPIVVKSEPVVADITEVGDSVSTDNLVSSDQTYVECIDAPVPVKHDPIRDKRRRYKQCAIIGKCKPSKKNYY